MPTAGSTDGGAILHPRLARERFTVDRDEPSPDVARIVDHYWRARWTIDAGEEHRQLVLSHPVVNVSMTAGTHRVVGPSIRPVERRLTGTGTTFGVMFRPGGFWPLLGRSVASIANDEAALADVLPAIAEPLGRAGDAAAAGAAPATVDDALAAGLPSGPWASEETTALAELARSDRGIVRAEQLAVIAGVSVRTLQRRFRAHVGLSPKQVIQRYRLQEVAERARHGHVDWAGVAAELGYADQAHLTRDFRAVIGETPRAYSISAR
jgi:AraC-like DNA-binding protein